MGAQKDSTVLGQEDRIAVFQEQAIRRTWYEGQWWFSVIDVVGVLSESAIPRRYWSDLKRTMAQEAGSEQPYEKIVRLKLIAPDTCAADEAQAAERALPLNDKRKTGPRKPRKSP